MNGDPVKVGKTLEVTRDEHRELAELGYAMYLASHHGHHGWLERFVLAHNAASRTLRRMIERSHRT